MTNRTCNAGDRTMTVDEDRDERTGDSQFTVHRTRHDFGGRRALSTTIIAAIEEATDLAGPSSLVLADVVDPDCLDGLFRPVRHRTDRDDGAVQFPLDVYWVTVHADGEVVIRRQDD
jgi:hypothetical protein